MSTHMAVVVILFVVALILLTVEWIIVNLAHHSVSVNLSGLAWIAVVLAFLLWHQGW